MLLGLQKQVWVKQPKVIINNGVCVPDGSGGNHKYVFKKDNYIYECYLIKLGSNDSAPAILSIYNGKKVVLEEKAIVKWNCNLWLIFKDCVRKCACCKSG